MLSNRKASGLLKACAVTAVTATSAVAIVNAQSQIISLGRGAPLSVAPGPSGSLLIGGGGITNSLAGTWNLNGTALTVSEAAGTSGGPGYLSADGAYAVVLIPNSPRIFGNTATGVSPPFRPDPTLIPSTAKPEATEFRAARWNLATNTLMDLGGLPIDGSLLVFGSSSSGGTTGNYISPNAISSDGRFIVGLGYICTYNSAAGTTISDNSFQWRPWIWDAQANAGAGGYTILPTPFRTSTNTWRRRTGNAYAVNTDGTVIVGAQEHNVAGSPGADPDGGRLVVWRLNSGTGFYEMTYLPNGTNGSGQFYTYSTTPRSVLMNAAGTMVVAMAVDGSGASFLGKWTWDAGTSTWTGPVNLGANLDTEASWLPGSVTSCGLPPILSPTAMSDDGNTIVGTARYSTCSGFMTGGFIWTSAIGGIADWYDYLVAIGVPDVATQYGPIGDNGDPLRGLPKLGSPLGISPDGNAVAGMVVGPSLIVGAPPSLVLFTGGPGCITPVITSSPANPTNFSACSSSIILNVSAAGTLPITFQWFKDGSPLADGPAPGGSNITGATTFQCRVNPPLSGLDAGVYHATATGVCGAPANSAAATVQLDPAFPAAPNDICATAQSIAFGNNVLAPAQSPCGAYDPDPNGDASCVSGGTRADRWFVYTPVATNNYRIDTCGANYDTVLSVFDACGGSELACNDNYNTGPSTGCTSSRSRIGSYNMIAGEDYYIRVAAPLAAFLSSTSTMNISISVAPPSAANDACGAASLALLGANAFDTTEASPDGFFVGCSGSAQESRDVWFQFTPTASGLLDVATCPGTSINTVLSLHLGLCGPDIACNDNANVSGCTNQSIIADHHVAAGQTYAIRVAGTNLGTFGAGVLTLSLDCDADFDNNGAVDLSDLSLLLANFGCTSGCTIDLNGDGITDLADLTLMLSAFGSTCI